ncbi:MAG: hypothetical protein NT062_36060 [Proteobacteria bacterium]|nr:hypothetical protein [Pseudomonadota bacterium]
MKKRKRKNAASVKDHQGAADALHKATTYLDEALKHVNGRVPATEIDGLLRAKKYARDAGSMLEDRMFRDHGSDRESMGTYYPRDRIVPPGGDSSPATRRHHELACRRRHELAGRVGRVAWPVPSLGSGW